MHTQNSKVVKVWIHLTRTVGFCTSQYPIPHYPPPSYGQRRGFHWKRLALYIVRSLIKYSSVSCSVKFPVISYVPSAEGFDYRKCPCPSIACTGGSGT